MMIRMMRATNALLRPLETRLVWHLIPQFANFSTMSIPYNLSQSLGESETLWNASFLKYLGGEQVAFVARTAEWLGQDGVSESHIYYLFLMKGGGNKETAQNVEPGPHSSMAMLDNGRGRTSILDFINHDMLQNINNTHDFLMVNPMSALHRKVR